MGAEVCTCLHMHTHAQIVRLILNVFEHYASMFLSLLLPSLHFPHRPALCFQMAEIPADSIDLTGATMGRGFGGRRAQEERANENPFF